MRTFISDYNFHGLVRLRVRSSKRALAEYLSREFAPCAVSGTLSAEPDIDVFIDLPHDWTGNSYDHFMRKLFRVRYTIGDLEQSTTRIAFQSDWTSHIYTPVMGTFLQTSVIEPIIYYKCLAQDSLLLHSACISNGRKAFLFIASGGSGKTTAALKLVNLGLRFMGDDLTFVASNGIALPYPRPLHLFSYAVQGLPFLKLSFRQRITLFWKDVLRFIFSSITRERFFIATRIPLHEVLPSAILGTPVPISRLYLLKRGLLSAISPITNADSEQLAKRILAAGDIDKVLKGKLLNGDSGTRIKTREIDLARQIVHSVPEIFEIDTRALDERGWMELANDLKAV